MIDSLLKNNALSEKTYDVMSFCGGGLKGYYYDTSLVFISSHYGYEAGYTKYNVHFRNDSILKIECIRHIAEWEKHKQHYPKEPYPYKNMTYADTTFVISMAKDTLRLTYLRTKLKTNKIDYPRLDRLINCCKSMQLELEGKQEEAIEIIKKKKQLIILDD